MKMKFVRKKSGKKDGVQFTDQTRGHVTKLMKSLTNFIYKRVSPM